MKRLATILALVLIVSTGFILSPTPRAAPTELKHTVAPAGTSPTPDFNTLAAACAHLDGLNLVTADQYASIEIYGDWSGGPDTAAVTLIPDVAMVTDATRYVRIYTTGLAARTAASPLRIDTTKYVLSVTNANAFYIRFCNFVKLDGLQIVSAAQSSSTAQNVFTSYISGAGNFDISNCVFKGSGSATYSQIGLEVSGGTPNVNIWNSLFYNFDTTTSDDRVIEGRNTTQVYSTTSIGGYYGIIQAAGTLVAKNSYSGGSGAGGDWYNGTLTTCASSDGATRTGIAAAVRSIAVSATNFVNVTATTENYHLKVGTALINAGTDTSGDAAPLNFTVDIDGDTRATWDISADEYVAPAGGWTNMPAAFHGIIWRTRRR